MSTTTPKRQIDWAAINTLRAQILSNEKAIHYTESPNADWDIVLKCKVRKNNITGEQSRRLIAICVMYEGGAMRVMNEGLACVGIEGAYNTLLDVVLGLSGRLGELEVQEEDDEDDEDE